LQAEADESGMEVTWAFLDAKGNVEQLNELERFDGSLELPH
jgi:uncharacterized protein GlcG (DUF336 family)